MIEITFFDKRTPITYKNDSALDYDIIKFVSGMYTQINTIKLPAKEEGEEQKKFADEKRSQVGTGDRSEKIRTYNFPQDRVTDHRIRENFHGLPKIMEGNMGPIVDALQNFILNQPDGFVGQVGEFGSGDEE
jgi:hypothetical protein